MKGRNSFAPRVEELPPPIDKIEVLDDTVNYEFDQSLHNDLERFLSTENNVP